MLDPRNSHVDNSNFQLFDPFRSINSSHLLPDKAKRQTPERHDDWEEGEVDLKLLESEKEEEDSGIQSPPLWKNNNNNSPIMHHHHPLSPNSRRREAIVRGQRELMDMVKNLPESCYELSLKDLVEHIPRAAQNQQECLLQQEDDDDHDQIQTQSNRQGSKKFDKKRGYSVENNNKGMFLKMAFPVGNRTRKSIVLLNSSSSSSSSKGSSKLLDGNGKTSKNSGDTDKYWWKKRFSKSSESDSSRSSSHSRSITSSSSSSSRSSTSTRERRTMLPNCMTCFQSSKNQAAE